MKAYTVHQYYLCQITGRVLLEVSFAISEGLKTFLHPFSCDANAKAYLEKEKRDWLIACLTKFVLHKKHIIEVSKRDAQTKELAICLEAINRYNDLALDTICKKFLAGFNYFAAIVPGTGNDSHLSSVENLNELKRFCETELKTNPK